MDAENNACKSTCIDGYGRSNLHSKSQGFGFKLKSFSFRIPLLPKRDFRSRFAYNSFGSRVGLARVSDQFSRIKRGGRKKETDIKY